MSQVMYCTLYMHNLFIPISYTHTQHTPMLLFWMRKLKLCKEANYFLHYKCIEQIVAEVMFKSRCDSISKSVNLSSRGMGEGVCVWEGGLGGISGKIASNICI